MFKKLLGKRILIFASIVLVVSLTSLIFVLRREPSPHQTQSIADFQGSPQSDLGIVNEPTAEVSTPPESTVPKTAVSEPAPQPEPPKYGENPSVTGQFVVFDKDWLLNESGISQVDRIVAKELITKLSNWTYKNSNHDSSTICGDVVPKTKMSSAGEDYETNPITQLRWCDSYVKGRYGSWQQANEFYDSNSHKYI